MYARRWFLFLQLFYFFRKLNFKLKRDPQNSHYLKGIAYVLSIIKLEALASFGKSKLRFISKNFDELGLMLLYVSIGANGRHLEVLFNLDLPNSLFYLSINV